MAPRSDDPIADELRRQGTLDASYASAQRRLRDEAFTARLRQRLAELDADPRASRLSRRQFLEQTSPDR